MRVWTIANGRAGSEWCGGCGQPVQNGNPMQKIVLKGIRDRKRCTNCASGDVDWNQVQEAKAELAGRETATRDVGFQPLSNAARRVFDPKIAAAGGRED